MQVRTNVVMRWGEEPGLWMCAVGVGLDGIVATFAGADEVGAFVEEQ